MIRTWNNLLTEEFKKPYMASLLSFLNEEGRKGKTIYPDREDTFKALDLTPFEDVRVVIVGQDPYINPNQAHGLAFSVKEGSPVPSSLQNIYKELNLDGCKNGCLKHWAAQGVLLLNNVLTVEAGMPKSHYNKGWEQFTDRVIELINDQKENVVFMLWGSEAQKKGHKIDEKKHLVLRAPHPSPLSAHKGFLGCKHFNLTNLYLLHSNQRPINWEVVSTL